MYLLYYTYLLIAKKKEQKIINKIKNIIIELIGVKDAKGCMENCFIIESYPLNRKQNESWGLWKFIPLITNTIIFHKNIRIVNFDYMVTLRTNSCLHTYVVICCNLLWFYKNEKISATPNEWDFLVVIWKCLTFIDWCCIFFHLFELWLPPVSS